MSHIFEDDLCVVCHAEERMGEHPELCAECYWVEDAKIKRERRPHGGYGGWVPPELVDVDLLAVRATSPDQVPGWNAFWAHFAPPPIKAPQPKNPCRCGAESTRRVNGMRMCDPCADYVQNVGRCTECGVFSSRPHKRTMCYECCMEEDS